MAELKIGSSIKVNGDSAKVIDELGRGGQGVVYLVEYRGKKYALKWYFYEKIKNPKAFKENIVNNIKDGSPSENFLWPQYVTDGVQNGSFGYLMNLIPSRYYGMEDILNTYKISKTNGIRKIPVKFKDLYASVNAALNIVVAFRDLHRAGKSYQDLNDGGFYIDIETGDILVCDCDNVAPHGENFGIGGMPGYMAPEIVIGVAKPDIQTDKHSLAVVLFKLLCRHDPLEGAKVLSSVCIHEAADLKHYGKEPVFVYDPDNKANRPVKGVHDNVINLWRIYPEYIKEAFIKAFTEGLKDPGHRVIETEWQKLLSRLREDIIACRCGYVRYSTGFAKNKKAYKCPKCGKTYMIMNISNTRNHETISIPIYPGQKIYKCFTENLCSDFETVVATIAESKKHPGVYGMLNKSDKEIKITLPNGNTGSIKPGSAQGISEGMVIEFGKGITAKL